MLFMVVVMITFDRCLLDPAIHAFDLAIGPWMFDFCPSVVNAILGTDTIKDMNAGKVGEWYKAAP